MLALSSHPFKVNFCKFTNETRNAIEDATRNSDQFYLTAIGGPCAGGGYELALATDYIIMADDGSTNVSLPEVPLLAVLPGTGGLTRLVDKRGVRRDRADFFCTTEEGIKGKRAMDWRLVDEVAPRTRLGEVAMQRAQEFAAKSTRPANAKGIALTPLARATEEKDIGYDHLKIELDRDRACASFLLRGPERPAPKTIEEVHSQGCEFWPLAIARELDDARSCICASTRTRCVPGSSGTEGNARRVESYDSFLCKPVRMAGARDPSVPEAYAETHRRELPLGLRADEPGLLLRYAV